ncbi:MAG TPA: preprotein translocase subunit SecE [Candidatus Paceibacterota bacterium]
MLSKIKSFFQEARQEFNRINWPTFRETRRLTYIVIGLSLAVALFLGVLDFVFTTLLDRFLIS